MIGIREALPQDAGAVFEVVHAAFGERAEAELVERLRADGDTVFSLVAEEEGSVVGHVLLSKMEAPFRALALAPVSVAPARQRRGIGSALIENAIGRTRDAGWDGIFVLGDPGYYERFGFDCAAASGFASPYAGPHFMLLKLSTKAVSTTGELRHARAFAALD